MINLANHHQNSLGVNPCSKLSRELSKTSTGKTLYILDEQTTGLHFQDIKKLIAVLNRLVDKVNTAVVIEHNLDVIKLQTILLILDQKEEMKVAESSTINRDNRNTKGSSKK